MMPGNCAKCGGTPTERKRASVPAGVKPETPKRLLRDEQVTKVREARLKPGQTGR